MIPLFLGFLAIFVSHVAAQWQLAALSSHEMSSAADTLSNTSITFAVQRGSANTACSTNWVQYPSSSVLASWIECSDPMLRFRVEQFTDASNFTLEVVEVDLIQTSTPPTVNVTRTTVSTNSSVSCSIPKSQCALSKVIPLTVTISSFTPSPLSIYYALARDDGPQSGVIPCTEAWTFYISNPNVPTLGKITLGRGSENSWLTHCDSNWACGGTDPSINSWTSCAAPAFQFLKTLPAKDGDQISNFGMNITHTFPLMMATSIRGSNAPDYTSSDPEEASGLLVKLVLASTVWANGSSLYPITGGGIDQTGNCATGCEFGGSKTSVAVVDVQII